MERGEDFQSVLISILPGTHTHTLTLPITDSHRQIQNQTDTWTQEHTKIHSHTELTRTCIFPNPFNLQCSLPTGNQTYSFTCIGLSLADLAPAGTKLTRAARLLQLMPATASAAILSFSCPPVVYKGELSSLPHLAACATGKTVPVLCLSLHAHTHWQTLVLSSRLPSQSHWDSCSAFDVAQLKKSSLTLPTTHCR